jgi:hypothetical protein
MLGRAKKVMIDKEDTTIVGGAGKKGQHPAAYYPIKTTSDCLRHAQK